MKKSVPDFIIVGTMKSGSTSLLHHFDQHENIHVPKNEVHFFNNDDKFHNKGVDWYMNILTKDASTKATVIGEKTPTYSYQENVAERIKNTFPNTKIIWVFRNPADRAYSNYLHAYKQGKENLSFEEAIRKEEKRIKSNIFKGYKKRSIYHEQVARYVELFPEENMFYLLFEEMIKPYDDKHVLNDLFDFLGVSSDNFTFEKESRNVTKIPRYPRVRRLAKKAKLYRISPLRKLIEYISFYKVEPGYEKMSSELRNELVEYFKPHNKKLEKIIGKDLSIWDK